MAHTDLHLLRAILVSSDLQTPLRLGINTGTFLTQDGKVGFDLIMAHFNNRDHIGQVPSFEAFRCLCPTVARKLPDDDMTILEASKIALEAAQTHVWNETLNLAISKENVQDGIAVMQAGIDRIMTFNTKDKVHDFGYEAYAHVMDEYVRIKNSGGMVGYPWPDDWAVLNDRTGGIEKGMYIVIHGRPGNMKSYILCKLAIHFLETTDLRVYFFNNEMTTEKLLTRLALLYARVSSRRYRKGLLSMEEEVRLQSRLAELRSLTETGQKKSRIAISDPDWSRTVSEMGARLREHNSDICLLDGGYLMMTNKGYTAEKPEHATRISRAIQRQCVATQIPHIITTQTGRVAETQSIHQRLQTVSNIGYADAWGQDASLVIAAMLGEDELTMLFPKIREDTKCPAITINANPGEDFSYKGDFISTQLFEETGQGGRNGNRRQESPDEGVPAGLNLGPLRDSIRR